jgi:hypothetical protein
MSGTINLPRISLIRCRTGRIASAGHCVTFPQEVNEPAKIFPRLPSEINIVRVRKLGSICMFMHGEILHINCCSIILKSESSGGTLWGSMLFWNEHNFKEFLSELQRLPLYLKCRKLGVPYESPSNNEAKSELMKRKRRLQYKIQKNRTNQYEWTRCTCSSSSTWKSTL